MGLRQSCFTLDGCPVRKTARSRAVPLLLRSVEFLGRPEEFVEDAILVNSS